MGSKPEQIGRDRRITDTPDWRWIKRQTSRWMRRQLRRYEDMTDAPRRIQYKGWAA